MDLNKRWSSVAKSLNYNMSLATSWLLSNWLEVVQKRSTYMRSMLHACRRLVEYPVSALSTVSFFLSSCFTVYLIELSTPWLLIVCMTLLLITFLLVSYRRGSVRLINRDDINAGSRLVSPTYFARPTKNDNNSRTPSRSRRSVQGGSLKGTLSITSTLQWSHSK